MPRKFYIIDGHAQIFRAYFAPFRPLTSPTGEPTKATYVFAQMLLNLIEREKPESLAMVIDSGRAQLHRMKIYPQYKANRPPVPDDFRPQEQRILKLVADAGIPVLALPGYEADDIIATMAHRLADQDFDVYLVSKDKDLRQLVTPKVRLFDAQSGKTLDPAGVEAEYGYPPSLAIDVQTLMGDAIDNVPGIPGVGEKTAAKLLKQYGSVAGVLQHVEELTPKLRENMKANAHLLQISRQLVTLDCNVPLDIDWDKCRFNGVNKEALARHFEELGFGNLLSRLGGMRPKPSGSDAPITLGSGARSQKQEDQKGEVGFSMNLFGEHLPQIAAVPAASPAASHSHSGTLETSASCDYLLINTPELFEDFLRELASQSFFAFDTETDALGAMRSNVVGMSFSWKPQTGYYLPIAGPLGATVLPREATIARLKPILEDQTIGKCGHNIKYDALAMRKLGVMIRGIRIDSMIAAFVLDSGRDSYGIDRLAVEVFGFQKIATKELIGSGKNQISMLQVPVEQVARYAAEDADIALRLARKFREELDAQPELAKLYDELENPLIDALVQLEWNGVSVDPAVLKQQSVAMGKKIDVLYQQLMSAAGSAFNPDSPKQVADVLFNRLGLRVIKRNRTGPSTDVEVLEILSTEHEVPRLMLDHRALVKLKNTYLDTLTEWVNVGTQRIHASFSQIGAETGRLSCNDPNLQNIPIRSDEGRAIRLAFVPADAGQSVLLTSDYSQIELRILAHFTREPALVKAFDTDQDIHAIVAAEVFGVEVDKVTREQRAQAKVVNFGIIYGISAFGLAKRIEGMSQQAAAKLIDAYHARFPSIEKFLQTCVEQAKAQGYVTTIMNRRRRLPLIDSSITAQRKGAERMAINSVIQGSAADLIKLAMLNIHRRLMNENRPSRMLLQVHDELVFEIPKASVEAESAMIKQEMEQAMTLTVPLKVEIGWGANWQEGK